MVRSSMSYTFFDLIIDFKLYIIVQIETIISVDVRLSFLLSEVGSVARSRLWLEALCNN